MHQAGRVRLGVAQAGTRAASRSHVQPKPNGFEVDWLPRKAQFLRSGGTEAGTKKLFPRCCPELNGNSRARAPARNTPGTAPLPGVFVRAYATSFLECSARYSLQCAMCANAPQAVFVLSLLSYTDFAVMMQPSHTGGY